jgi:hypothetical protein
MNPYEEDRPTQPRRNMLWLLPAFLLIVMLTIVTATVMCLRLVERIGETGGLRQTASDFATDDERIGFVQQFSPVTIPRSATDFTIEQDPVNEGYRQATFTLSAEDFGTLAGTLQRERSLDGEGTFKYPGPLSDDDQTSYKLDPRSYRVEVYYVDP